MTKDGKQVISLSVAIIARDEERHIGACLQSVAGMSDDIVVLLDQRSTDRTGDICRSYGAQIYHEAWRGFAGQRNRALSLCRSEWVLFVDADERVTPKLRQELVEWLRPTADVAGYDVPRHNIFFGQVLRGGGWYPDHQLRLLRRARAHYDEGQLVHERAELDGSLGTLEGHLLHLNIENLAEFWHKQTIYALAEARILQSEGRRARWRNFVGAPAREFWRRYIGLGGWRDGLLGVFLCSALAWFELVKFGFLRVLPPRTE
jgi:glycosyltransferase involved in cell wall biosynthesis